MFICQICGKPSKPGEKCHFIIAKRKLITHPFRSSVHKMKNLETGRSEYKEDPGGKGFQIAKELKACGSCKDYTPAND